MKIKGVSWDTKPFLRCDSKNIIQRSECTIHANKAMTQHLKYPKI